MSARTIRGILEDFAANGGTVVLSSHVMDLVERICTDVAIIAAGVVRAAGHARRRAGRLEPGGPLPRPGRRAAPRGGTGVVAHLVRLKLHLLRNGLRRSVAAIVGMVVGLALRRRLRRAAPLVGLVALRAQADVELARTVVVVGGSALWPGWALLPIILFGVDPTLDPTRFATFAVPRADPGRRAGPHRAWSGCRASPRSLLVLGSVVAGSRSLAAPRLVALLGGLRAALLTCVLLSRIVTVRGRGGAATRRGRDLAGVGGLLLFVVDGPLLAASPTAGLTRAGWTGSPTCSRGRRSAGPGRRPGDVALGELGHRPDSASRSPRCSASVLFVAWERLLVSVLRNPRSASTTGSRTGRGSGCSACCRARRWAPSRRGPAPTGSGTRASTSRRS